MYDNSGCSGRAGQCETEPWAENGPDAVRAARPTVESQGPAHAETAGAHTRRCLLLAVVEVYGNRITTRATGILSLLAEVPASVLIIGVENRTLARSRQAERCSRRAVVTLIGDSKNAVISSRPEKQKVKYALL